MTEQMTSDDLLREMLYQRAARATAAGLLEAIVREAGTTAQRPSARLGRWRVGSWSDRSTTGM